MKKFYTIISSQIQGELGTYRYEAVDNRNLALELEVSFPILTAVAGYVAPGEEFRVVVAYPANGQGRRHLKRFQEQLEQVCRAKGLTLPRVDAMELPRGSGVAGQAATFQKLITYAQDDDEIFACMTFGTKPLTSALLMAVRYAYRVKKNTSISCVVYGEVSRPDRDRSAWHARVYDMTALIQLDEIVRRLAENKTADPRAAIDAILAL